MSEYSVEVINLCKSINSQYILNNINMNFKRGNIYSIVGANGSGKSMLLKSIAGLILPDKGTIKIYGEELRRGEFYQKIGLLLDSPGLLPQYSAVKNLEILASINNKISTREIKDFLMKLGLNPEDKRSVKKYSLGMKQKVGIVQALMENPEIIILDEPMNGLDENSAEIVRNLLFDLKNENKTIIITSHNKEDIELLSDYIYKIEKGCLVDF
jgi:ABC-2 type transport system ATP-binding protein